ncbi:MAG TPA: ester cyclase [Candidatus Limnocylindrales bacterium]
MSTDANKEVVRRFVDQVFVNLNTSAVDELVADDFVSHNWPSDPDSKTALKAATERLGQGLADISFSVDDLIAEDDRVVARLTARARQVGPFMGLPASGRSYEIGEIHIFRLRDGKLVEHWYEMDAMGLMKQLKGD